MNICIQVAMITTSAQQKRKAAEAELEEEKARPSSSSPNKALCAHAGSGGVFESHLFALASVVVA